MWVLLLLLLTFAVALVAIDYSGEVKEINNRGYEFIEQRPPMGEPVFQS